MLLDGDQEWYSASTPSPQRDGTDTAAIAGGAAVIEQQAPPPPAELQSAESASDSSVYARSRHNNRGQWLPQRRRSTQASYKRQKHGRPQRRSAGDVRFVASNSRGNVAVMNHDDDNDDDDYDVDSIVDNDTSSSIQTDAWAPHIKHSGSRRRSLSNGASHRSTSSSSSSSYASTSRGSDELRSVDSSTLAYHQFTRSYDASVASIDNDVPFLLSPAPLMLSVSSLPNSWPATPLVDPQDDHQLAVALGNVRSPLQLLQSVPLSPTRPHVQSLPLDSAVPDVSPRSKQESRRRSISNTLAPAASQSDITLGRSVAESYTERWAIFVLL